MLVHRLAEEGEDIIYTKTMMQMSGNRKNNVKKTIKKCCMKTVLICLLLYLLVPPAFASPADELFSEGWEFWTINSSVEDGVTHYELLCPETDISVEDLQAYMLAVMRYCRSMIPQPSQVTVRFLYETADFSVMMKEITVAIDTENGLRALGNSFLHISSCRLKNKDDLLKEVAVVLQVNNPASASVYAPEITYGEALAAARELAEEIRTKATEPSEQLVLLNEYMMTQVSYGSVAEEKRAHSTVGVLLDGMATCAGFANTVSDVCYLLGIPSYQLRDVPGNHVWNVVTLDGAPLMLDTTFNNTGRTKEFFLSRAFDKNHHSYTEELCARLQGYADELYQADAALDKLREQGIIQGNGSGDYALGGVLTYEELAAILCRLDNAQVQIQTNETRLSALGAGVGSAVWAQAQVGYCIEQQYFDSKLSLSEDSRVTVQQAQQVLLRSMGGVTEEGLLTGDLMLRGDFFQMLAAQR